MNQWNAAVLRVGQTLSVLVSAPTGPTDLHVALAARAAVLDHVSHVLGEVVPRTRTRHAARNGAPVSLALVERDPLDALGRLLHARRRPELDRSPSELLDQRQAEPSAARWAEAGRFAVLAQDAWDRGAARPFSDLRRTQMVAEVAALAEAVAVLDVALVQAAGDRADVAAILCSTAGLRLAAREVGALAAVDLAAAPAPVVPGADVAAALSARSSRAPKSSRELGSLTTLLGAAEDLSPHQVRAAARVARDLSVLAARDAVDPQGRHLREELGALAKALHAVVRTDRGEFALNPAQNRTIELSLRDLHASNRLAVARGVGFGADEAGRVARRLPGFVAALTDRAIAQIDERRWAVPDRAKDATLRYAFATTTGGIHRPPIVGGLVECASAARRLQRHAADPLVPSGLAATLAALPALQRPRSPAASGAFAPPASSRATIRREQPSAPSPGD